MRILYTAMEHDYGDRRRGPSFEQASFHAALVGMGCEVIHYDAVARAKDLGPGPSTRRLAEIAAAERPDLIFCVLFEGELDPERFPRVGERAGAPSVNWFCDDHWRYESYSAAWAPAFDLVVTTCEGAAQRHAAAPGVAVLRSQWAAEHRGYRPPAGTEPGAQPPEGWLHAVSFVGQPHGDRRRVIAALRDAGVPVAAYGLGWERGRLGQAEMVEVFGRSRVNLNLSNASTAARGAADPTDPGAARLQQVKGRNFEVPACGGVVLTGEAGGLGDCFVEGEEVAVFRNLDDLIDQARGLLADEPRRARIAAAGHARTLRDHTWCHRFDAVFRAAGVAAPPLATLLDPPAAGLSRRVA